uniref:Uncharacterized protein n=1 Tax=Arundo donax TaxID=35708 RepID=A0A0A8YX38_ARUDO
MQAFRNTNIQQKVTLSRLSPTKWIIGTTWYFQLVH